MAVARYYKTLFLPPLQGQYILWKSEFTRLAAKVDEIVQLGNLIGCHERFKDKERVGPNLAALNYTLLWRATYSNWVQLIGPNEILALNFPDEWTNNESNRILRRRWFDREQEGRFRVAAVNKSRLVTHGGLTYGEWVSLGRPQTAEEAAEALNEKYETTLYQGPSFKLTGKPNYAANPIFADPLRELYPSWTTAPEELPFSQMHGSGGLNTREGHEARSAAYSPLEFIDAMSSTNFGSIVTVGSQKLFSVYPDIPTTKLLKKMPEPWQVYIEKVPVLDLREELFLEDSK